MAASGNAATKVSRYVSVLFGPLLYGADPCLGHLEDRSGSAYCPQCWMSVVEAAAKGRDLADERPVDLDG